MEAPMKHHRKVPDRDKHHLYPKFKSKILKEPPHEVPENKLLIKRRKHVLLHEIFGNADLEEIVSILVRTARAKRYERVNPKMARFYQLV
jgi:hypothetical protein